MPEYRPVTLDPPGLLPWGTWGTCRAWCGREETILAGTINDEPLCSTCYEESKTRSFAILSRDGEDLLCDRLTLEGALAEIASFLASPVEWARYAPFRVVAVNTSFNLEDHVCTVTMPEAEVRRSRQVYYGSEE